MTTLNELLIKGGIRKGFQNGTTKMAKRPCYGYTTCAPDKIYLGLQLNR
jgi:hypothetical protein